MAPDPAREDDPENCIPRGINPGETIIMNGTDSEEEETPDLGQYQPLPQNDDLENHGDSDENDDTTMEDIQAYLQQQQSEPSNPEVTSLVRQAETMRIREEADERAALWQEQQSGPDRDIQMDDEKVEKIKSVMARLSLPKMAVPAWAREMSEEEWKDLMKNKVKGGGVQKKS